MHLSTTHLLAVLGLGANVMAATTQSCPAGGFVSAAYCCVGVILGLPGTDISVVASTTVSSRATLTTVPLGGVTFQPATTPPSSSATTARGGLGDLAGRAESSDLLLGTSAYCYGTMFTLGTQGSGNATVMPTTTATAMATATGSGASSSPTLAPKNNQAGPGGLADARWAAMVGVGMGIGMGVALGL